MATRLLVVDDDPDMRHIARVCFRDLPIEIETVGDGREALTKIFASWESQPYDGVLFDCAMPVLDGPSLALLVRDEEIKRRREPIKIGFLTAYGEEVEAGRFPEKAQASFYLRKPVDLRALRAGVTNWLGH